MRARQRENLCGWIIMIRNQCLMPHDNPYLMPRPHVASSLGSFPEFKFLAISRSAIARRESPLNAENNYP